MGKDSVLQFDYILVVYEELDPQTVYPVTAYEIEI